MASRDRTLDYVTSDRATKVTGAMLREVFALLFLIAGTVGLTFAAFMADWRLGIAAVSIEAIGAGIALGYER